MPHFMKVDTFEPLGSAKPLMSPWQLAAGDPWRGGFRRIFVAFAVPVAAVAQMVAGQMGRGAPSACSSRCCPGRYCRPYDDRSYIGGSRSVEYTLSLSWLPPPPGWWCLCAGRLGEMPRGRGCHKSPRSISCGGSPATRGSAAGPRPRAVGGARRG